MNDPTQPAATLTLASEARDFPEWHHGRPYYALWALAIDDAAVEQRLALLRLALQPLLLPGYRRQAHVTLQLCGFPAADARRPDDYGLAQFEAQVAAVQQLRLAPFTLHIGAAFSFVSAPCLAVHDGSGALARLRQAWAGAAPHPDRTPYVPHVTAGLYRDAWPMAEVKCRLQALGPLPEIELSVQHLDWMVYDSAQVGGPLRSLRRFDLAGNRLLPAAADAESDPAAEMFSPPR